MTLAILIIIYVLTALGIFGCVLVVVNNEIKENFSIFLFTVVFIVGSIGFSCVGYDNYHNTYNNIVELEEGKYFGISRDYLYFTYLKDGKKVNKKVGIGGCEYIIDSKVYVESIKESLTWEATHYIHLPEVTFVLYD